MNSPDEEAIFHVARAIASPEAQAAYLAEACGENIALRKRIEALVEAFGQNSLISPAASLNQQPLSERPGSIIGRYKLLEQIGEGGFGVVFMAEQTHPVRRKVALKVIKAGMDTKQVIARFEAERQALALMEHPNIARVFDAGATDTGRPFFVMELVHGIPITEYCDKEKLTPRRRLELFVQVCQAVQHAHQKGIIHRDIKPSNVLVTLHDGVPVPKVIDFGIAKATGPQLTEKTLFTNFAQMVGTPLYMSPEQAEMSGLDADTRSDIYSLGVLLYELLTGTTPFDKDRLRKAAFDEIRRIIREEEPPRPSTRLSTSEALPSIAASRGVEAKKLSGTVRGELDWIVMKAMEKDRTRRYETANGLARDVERYLSDEAVTACPPSARYRFGKFARRNKVVIVTTSLVATALVLGIIVSTWQAVRARRANAEAVHQAQIARTEADKQEAVNSFLNEMLQAANPWAITANESFKGKDATVLQVINSAVRRLDAGSLKDRPEIEAAVRKTIGETYGSLGQLKAGEEQLRKALELNRRVFGPEGRQVAASMIQLAHLMGGGWDARKQPAARRAEAESLMRDGLAMQRKLLGDTYVVAETMCGLSAMLQNEAKLAEAEQLARQALLIMPSSAASLGQLAEVLRKQGNLTEAEALYRRAIAKVRQTKGENHPAVWTLSRVLADVLSDQGRFSEAETIYREALAVARKMRPYEDPAVKWIVNHLADVLRAQGKNGEADAIFREQELAARQALAGEPNSAELRKKLGDLLNARGNFSEAASEYGEAIRLQPDMVEAWAARGECRARTGDFANAIEDYSEAIRLRPDNWSYWHERAYAYLVLGEHKKTIADYSKAIEMGDRDAGQRLRRGLAYRGIGEVQKAEQDFSRAIELADNPEVQNSLAWELARIPKPGLFDPRMALDLAEKAAANQPSSGNIWNTLGVVRYRNGQWKEALTALEKSMELRHGGDAYDWLFAAMAHWQLGEKDTAGKLYDQAAQWMDKNMEQNRELRRFRCEAAELLGLPLPATQSSPTTQVSTSATRPS